MSFPFFFSFFFPNVDVRCQTVVLAENEKKKKLLEDGGGKKGAQKKKKGKKKTAFDRVLLESKPRDTFESLEMHLFFFLKSIPSSDVNTQSVK